MHIYESHLGGLYASDEYDEGYTAYCEQCGDSDQYLGFFKNAKELYDDQAVDYEEDGIYHPYELSYLEELFTDASN